MRKRYCLEITKGKINKENEMTIESVRKFLYKEYKIRQKIHKTRFFVKKRTF